MQNSKIKRKLLVILMTLTGFLAIHAQTNLNMNGDPHKVDYNDNNRVQEFKLPNDITHGRIYLEAIGADGGVRRNKDGDQVLAQGGQGAVMGAWFEIGKGSGKIPPGSTILFIIGERGTSVSTGVDGSGAGGGGTAIFYQPPNNGRWTILVAAGAGEGGGGKVHGGPGETFGCVDIDSPDYGKNDAYCFVLGPYSSLFPCDAGGSAFHDTRSQQYEDFYDEEYYTCSTGGQSGWPGATTFPTSPVKPTGGEGTQPKSGIDGGFGFGGGSAGSKGTSVPGSGGGFTGASGSGGGSYINPNNKMTQYEEKRIRRGNTQNPQHGRVRYKVLSAPVAICNDLTLEFNNPDPKFIPVTELVKNTFSYMGEPLYYNTPTALENGTLIRLSCENAGSNIFPINVIGGYVGYTSNCNATIHIVENTTPVLECQDIEVTAKSYGEINITPKQLMDKFHNQCMHLEPAKLWFDDSKLTYSCVPGGQKTESVLLS
ncbi:MAG: hypothetical protein AAFO07_07220, partial [Bacteroidota bacterium]